MIYLNPLTIQVKKLGNQQQPLDLIYFVYTFPEIKVDNFLLKRALVTNFLPFLSNLMQCISKYSSIEQNNTHRRLHNRYGVHPFLQTL